MPPAACQHLMTMPLCQSIWQHFHWWIDRWWDTIALRSFHFRDPSSDPHISQMGADFSCQYVSYIAAHDMSTPTWLLKVHLVLAYMCTWCASVHNATEARGIRCFCEESCTLYMHASNLKGRSRSHCMSHVTVNIGPAQLKVQQQIRRSPCNNIKPLGTTAARCALEWLL